MALWVGWCEYCWDRNNKNTAPMLYRSGIFIRFKFHLSAVIAIRQPAEKQSYLKVIINYVIVRLLRHPVLRDSSQWRCGILAYITKTLAMSVFVIFLHLRFIRKDAWKRAWSFQTYSLPLFRRTPFLICRQRLYCAYSVGPEDCVPWYKPKVF